MITFLQWKDAIFAIMAERHWSYHERFMERLFIQLPWLFFNLFNWFPRKLREACDNLEVFLAYESNESGLDLRE